MDTQQFNNTSVEFQIGNNDPMCPVERPEGWGDVLMAEAGLMVELGTGTHDPMPSNVDDFGTEHHHMVL